MNRLFLSLLAVALFLFPGTLVDGAEKWLIESQDVEVLFDTHLEEAARRVGDTYPVVRSEIEDFLGWQLAIRPRIVLISERDRFNRMIGNEHFVAFAVPGEDLIVIDYSRVNRHPFTLAVTVKHELCHLLLHQEIDSALLPRWLDEGVAQWVTGGIAEIIMERRSDILARAGVTGHYLPLDALRAGFPSHNPELSLAYEESKSFVEYLIGVYGEGSLLAILNRLAAGSSIEKAVDIVCGVPLESLEREWHGYLGNQFPRLTFLSRNLYQILFVFAALVTIFGFVRFIRKKRSYRDDEEDDDGDEEDDGLPPFYH